MSNTGGYEPSAEDVAWLAAIGANETPAPGSNVYESIDATEQDLAALESWLGARNASKAERLQMLDTGTE